MTELCIQLYDDWTQKPLQPPTFNVELPTSSTLRVSSSRQISPNRVQDVLSTPPRACPTPPSSPCDSDMGVDPATPPPGSPTLLGSSQMALSSTVLLHETLEPQADESTPSSACPDKRVIFLSGLPPIRGPVQKKATETLQIPLVFRPHAAKPVSTQMLREKRSNLSLQPRQMSSIGQIKGSAKIGRAASDFGGQRALWTSRSPSCLGVNNLNLSEKFL
ncbi:hypothetical protein P7C70_g3639, partial [Phenoliferia sp. Uapishka_3]